MTIYINTPGVYTLTQDVFDSFVISVEGVFFNGNGHTVHGDGDKSSPNSIGILSNAANTIVYNVDVEGFAAGVHLGGAHSQVSYTDVYNCHVRGIGIAGGNGLIHHSTAGYIGGATDLFGATGGMTAWGDNNVIHDSNVHNIYGDYESVGYAFGGSGQLINSLAQGQNATGWSFGVWVSGHETQVSITSSYIHSWYNAVATVGVTTVSQSTLQATQQAVVGRYVDGGNASLSQNTPDNSAYVCGTAERDHVIGGSADQIIVGMGGADILHGGGGNDIFACSYDAFSILPDFKQGDRVSTHYYFIEDGAIQNGAVATGTEATMLFNPENHTLYFDCDGGGPAAPKQIAYMPYVLAMTASDFIW